MFKDLKGGSVMLCNGGKYRTVNIAVYGGEPTLYAKVHGNSYVIMISDGRTTHGAVWQKLILPPTWGRAGNSALGYVHAENLVLKTKRRIGVK